MTSITPRRDSVRCSLSFAQDARSIASRRILLIPRLVAGAAALEPGEYGRLQTDADGPPGRLEASGADPHHAAKLLVGQFGNIGVIDVGVAQSLRSSDIALIRPPT